jgi:hypothetical protein
MVHGGKTCRLHVLPYVLPSTGFAALHNIIVGTPNPQVKPFFVQRTIPR